MTKSNRYRALFLSDLHLGTKGCQADLFLDFLANHDADTIYLVGDIVDGWRLRTAWYWPDSHHAIVQCLLGKAREGTRVIYLPGNHDAFARVYIGKMFGGIEVAQNATHVTADGRRFHVTHGDEYDIVIRRARWLAHMGDWAYRLALFGNTQINHARRRLGLPYWSFSAWAKLKVKTVVNFIGAFEQALAADVLLRSYDGVICGHIHHAAISEMKGITYVNTGDFVESCTAVVEHGDGQLELVRWLALRQTEALNALGPAADIPLPEYA